MRMLVQVTIPNDTFNEAVRDGTAGAKMGRILDEQKPEACYFTEIGGERTAMMVVNLAEAKDIPALAEPWFLTFGALVEIHPAMTPDDLAAAGLEGLAAKWG